MGSAKDGFLDPNLASSSGCQAQVIFPPLHLTSSVWLSSRHTTRPFFVTHPAPTEDGDDIRSIQEPHGHKIRQGPYDLQALKGGNV